MPCPGCGAFSDRVHAYHRRTMADVPPDARRVSVVVRARRLLCPRAVRTRQRFREQLPGVLERYQRCTPRPAGQIGAVVWELARRAGARVLSALVMGVSRHAAKRTLLRLPVPVPLGVLTYADRMIKSLTRDSLHRTCYRERVVEAL